MQQVKAIISVAAAALFLSTALSLAESLSKTTEVGRNQNRSADYNDTVFRFINHIKPKVVGGVDAPAGAFPWQVSLAVSWIADPVAGHFCGGTIYDENWIVTAAHCVEGLTPDKLQVIPGTNKLDQRAKRYNVDQIVQNKQYNATTMDNDIALIKLFAPIRFDKLTRPLKLAVSGDEQAIFARPVTVSGWGATTEGERPVRTLQYVDLPYVPRETCNHITSYDNRITENMICAGKAVGGVDSCQGDSGGPLVGTRKARDQRLVGIVSWGEGCAQPAKYGVYTRVSKYVDWVEKCIANPDGCL
jgi:secreted trypsin-like serine protease